MKHLNRFNAICASLLVLAILNVVMAVYLWQENEALKTQNKALSERVTKLPEAFGGVGYISEVNLDEHYIEAVGYGRFVITADEGQFLQVGDKLPTYIMERGAH